MDRPVDTPRSIDAIWELELETLRARVAALEGAEAARERAERRAALQSAVSEVLMAARTLDDALPLILRAVCESIGLTWGSVWTIDRRSNVLRCRRFWHEASERLTEFDRASLELALPSGVGLPGRVWKSGEPAWVPDVTVDDNFPRASAAAAARLGAAFAFPLRVAGRTSGVMEFFDATVSPPDSDLLALTRGVSGQIGQFIERTRIETELRNSESRIRAILESALDAIVTMNDVGTITEFNPAAQNMFGYSRERALGRELAELIVPKRLRGAHRDGLERYLQTGKGPVLNRRLELPAVRADGSEFTVELSITPVITDGRPLFTGYMRDVTERQRAEAQTQFLAESSVLIAGSLDYEETLASVARLVVPFLADWCVVYRQANDGSIRRIAMVHAGAEHEPVSRVMQEEFELNPDATAGAPNVIRTGLPLLYHDVTPDLLAADTNEPERMAELTGPLGILSWICVPLTMHNRVVGAISLMTAESGRRYTEADLPLAIEIGRRVAIAVENARLYREAQDAIRSREQFLSIASHELKTPLTSIKASSQLLERRLKDSELDRDRLGWLSRQMRTEIGRLEALVGDLLDASRISQGRIDLRRERMDLTALAGAAVERFEHAPDRTVRHTLRLDAIGPVEGEWDPARLDQVVTNLLSNALKYSPDGGEVCVCVRREGDAAVLSVADQGIGLSDEERSTLFEPFSRGQLARQQFGGVGLGLFITAQIVERHGGTIDVESAPNLGATFTVRLPSVARARDEDET